MEVDGGASVADMRIRDGKHQSVFRSYVFPRMDQPNLTVLPHALVTQLTFEGNRTTGVEISHEGSTRRIRAGCEVVLSLGAIHAPKVLMQSGIGDQDELRRFGIPVLLPFRVIWPCRDRATTRCN
jgi:choline dehydrogenase